MVPAWLTLYLMCGAIAGTLYASMATFGMGYVDGQSEWWAIPVVALISMMLVVGWPLWAGGALLCWTLQKLRVI